MTTRVYRRRLGLTAIALLVVACGGGVGDAGALATLTGPPGAASSPPAGTGSPRPSPTATTVAQASAATPFGSATPTPTVTTSPSASPTPTPTPHLTPSATPTVRHTPTASPSAETPSPTAAGPVTLVVYFLLDDGRGGGGTLVPVSRTVDSTRALANAALRELLKGPTRDELAAAAGGPAPFSLIPKDTLALGLDISGSGIATVDLSREFEGGAESSVFGRRLAQVVYTLTQFRTINGVRFRLDGKDRAVSTADGTPIVGPAGRDDYLALLPRIFVESPAWGATAVRPIVLRGRASVFEATFQLQLNDDDGRLIDRRSVTASCGAPSWCDWTTEIDITDVATERLWVTVWEPSAADGTPQNVRRFPIRLPPRV